MNYLLVRFTVDNYWFCAKEHLNGTSKEILWRRAMKTLLLLTTLISSSAFSATLKIPLFVEEDNKIVPVSKINEQYKLKGDKKLLEVLEVTNTAQSKKEAYATAWALREKVDQLAEEVNRNFFIATDRPGGFQVGNIRTCYTGSPDEAVEIASTMTDAIYSDQLGIIGYKFKKQTTLLEGQDPDEVLEYLNESSEIWRNWKNTNDDILVLSHESDGGEDVNEGILVKCK